METFTRAQAATLDGGKAKVAVLLPGVGYQVDGPLLYWVAEILAESGWHVQGVRWVVDGAAHREPDAFTAQAVERAFAQAPPASQRLVVAKSFGTMVIPWAERTRTAGIWLTPILTDPMIRETLAQTTKSDLFIGGSDDEYWDVAHQLETAGTFLEIPGANHSLQIPNNWRASLESQSRIFDKVAEFLTAIDGGIGS